MADRPGKWQEIPAGGPTAESTRGTVGAFLEEARRQFRKAVLRGMDNPEHAHQARVWSRRAGAAMALYRDWFADQPYRRVQQGLKGLREAADRARTWDVWVEWLRTQAGKPGVDAWLEQGEARREKAYRKLAQARWKNPDLKALRSRFGVMLEEVSFRGAGNPGNAMLEEVGKRIGRFFDTGPHGGSRPRDFHHFRIAGKKLRYTLELTHSLFPADAREELYVRLQQILDHLGAMNDLEVFLDQVSQSSLCGTEAGRWLQDELLIRQQQALGKYWECGHPEILEALRARFIAVCQVGE